MKNAGNGSPRLLTTPLVFAGLYLGISALLRLILWWRYGLPADVVPTRLPGLLSAGAVNDLVQLLYLLAPLALYLFLLPRRLAAGRWHLRSFALGTWLTLFGLLYLQAAEYCFFEEFDSRFNLVAVDYLLYPHEVLLNIWDTYPVLPVLLAVALLSALLCRWFWPLLRRDMERPLPLAARGQLLTGHLLLLVLAAVSFSTDTLAFSDNRVANEIAANGISSLFRAFRTNDLSYDRYYRTVDSQKAFRLARGELARGQGVGFTSGDQTDLNRTYAANPTGLGSMNVVVIVEESLGAGFVGAYGDSRGLTPNFDRLAADGLLFRNAFATGTRTVRGLEAITLSFPPIPSESVVKRPGSENVANWGKVMQDNGYHTSFLYGGYGYFDNMNHFYESNGFALSDRTDIPEPAFANIWGVSDEDLFRHALDYFDGVHKSGQPFFSIIMTTSNHTPYTFPSGIPGVPAQGGGRKAGIRYADYALGRLFEQAPRHSWFDNTLFVIVADHDARVYGRAQVPVKRYRIPLLVYAPGRVAPETVETPTSQIDIAPTVLGMLGLPYTAPFYGENVLQTQAGQPRPILLNHNHDVALLLEDRLVVLGLNRRAETYRYDAAADRLDLLPENRELTELATAYYQSAFELFRSHRYQ
jgi:phosphoglycerol transferase MdoB-like AlkP superfamily enzyme